MTLAIAGGKPAITTPLRKTNNINSDEADAAWRAVRNGVLSGYIGGINVGGPYVQALERMWEKNFGVKHAVACNSATSGLLAACMALDVSTGANVFTTPFTMSATAAAPRLLGAHVEFGDVDEDYFCLASIGKRSVATIVTNLFGHPAELKKLRDKCDREGVFLIEDNAQSILAKENGRYAGTIGHVGVFSLNVHKHIQCGEGGIVVTDNDGIARRVREAINHGEMAGGRVGLNLRLTEYAAAIAGEQLHKAEAIVGGNIDQAEALTHEASKFDWIGPPKVRPGCSHVYYCWAAKLRDVGINRGNFIAAMAQEGFPLHAGYVDPLYRLPAFRECRSYSPIAEKLHDESLFYFENTMYSLTDEHIEQFGMALKKVEYNLASSLLRA